jgi:hypothetical protein
MNTDFRTRFKLHLRIFLSVFISVHGSAALPSTALRAGTTSLWLLCLPAYAQEEGEIVVNLAAGRVAVLVAKEGIIVSAVQDRVEAESRPPLVVQLSERRVGIVLGAAEWLQPGTGAPAVRMDRQLGRLHSEIAGPKRLDTDTADDIEVLGLAMLEALRPMTSRLHNRIDVGEDEPLLELVLVGYVTDYGPEVWSVRYHVVQEPVRGSYWRTRVMRPRYTQLYPPEKGQPRTLMEIRHPATAEPPLLARFEKDPQLGRLRTGDEQLALVSDLVTKGESQKAKLDDALTWMRVLLDATTTADVTQIIGVIREEKGLEWILAPAETVERAEESAKPREPGAPTLRKKP